MSESIGERIRFARKRRDLTQTQLADIVGLTSDYLSGVERKGAKLSEVALRAIAAALSVSPEWLRTGNAGPCSLDLSATF